MSVLAVGECLILYIFSVSVSAGRESFLKYIGTVHDIRNGSALFVFDKTWNLVKFMCMRV